MNAMEFLTGKLPAADPVTVADVGAMGGVARKWNALGERCRILAFEPDPREFAKLRNTDRVTYINYLLAEKSQPQTFFISRNGGMSSISQPNLELLGEFENVNRFDVVDRHEIPAVRTSSFDDVVHEYELPDLDFVKLDTEGSELGILKGSTKKVLPQIFGLQIEVEFIEKCKNQPLFRDVDAFLNTQGFQLMDLRRQFWKRKDFFDYQGKGQIVFGDALYFKRFDCFFEQLKGRDNAAAGRNKVYKCAAVCLVYRMFDVAVSLVRRGKDQGFLSSEESQAAEDTIKAASRQGDLPQFPGRQTMYKIFNRITNRLKPSSYLGWSDSDRVIGNIADR